MVNCDLQFDKTGTRVAPELWEWTIVPEHLGQIPQPVVLNDEGESVGRLYQELRGLLPKDAYMASVFVGGNFTV